MRRHSGHKCCNNAFSGMNWTENAEMGKNSAKCTQFRSVGALLSGTHEAHFSEHNPSEFWDGGHAQLAQRASAYYCLNVNGKVLVNNRLYTATQSSAAYSFLHVKGYLPNSHLCCLYVSHVSHRLVVFCRMYLSLIFHINGRQTPNRGCAH